MADKRLTTINDVKVGDFVKLVDRDSQGRFTYVGEVISVEPGKKEKVNLQETFVGANFQMLTFDGVIGFNMEDPKEIDELYITTTKPAGWAKFKKSGKPVQTKKPPSEIELKKVKSKKQLVAELVAANPRKKEKSLLDLAKKEIGGNETQLLNYIKLALVKK